MKSGSAGSGHGKTLAATSSHASRTNDLSPAKAPESSAALLNLVGELAALRGPISADDLLIDGMVEPCARSELSAGQVGIDPPGLIHSVCNAAQSEQTLVSLHVYAPPLPERRGYRTRAYGTPPDLFRRAAAPGAAVVAIIGGGFSGVMVGAHLVQEASAARRPLHLVIIDRQTALGEGTAYRTPDSSHVLNLPASHMSAWPGRPEPHWTRLLGLIL